MNNASLFPMFLKLEGRNCLVLGAGGVGEQKIRSLLDCGAHLRVVAPFASALVREWADRGELTWVRREFEFADLDGVFLPSKPEQGDHQCPGNLLIERVAAQQFPQFPEDAGLASQVQLQADPEFDRLVAFLVECVPLRQRPLTG